MGSRLGRALRGLPFVCVWLAAVPAMAQISNEGAIPDGRGGVGVLTIGAHHTCGIRQDGTVLCWGDNFYGEATPLPGTFMELSAGYGHTCGLRGDGSVACWGSGYTPLQGEPEPPMPLSPIPAGRFTAISSAISTTCGLRARSVPWEYPEGNLVCWNASGWQLPAPPQGDFVAVSVGYDFSCALRANGKPACWGYLDPAQVPAEDTFIAVSTGAHHACGLHADGSVRCWGDNWSGQATPPAELFTAISAGSYNTCGLRPDGTVLCWGDNGGGEFTPPPDRFSALAAGENQACGLRPDGHVACWGKVNWNFQPEPPSPYTMPPLMPQDTVFGMGQLAAGDWHHCQINAQGELACWGGFPQEPEPLARFTALSSGWDATCARDEQGVLRCYGLNEMVRIDLPFEPLRQFDLGYEHGCGVAALDGSPKCWGRETNDKTLPPAEPPGQLFRNTSAGLMHSCGVTADGQGQCWGYGGDGQTYIPPLPHDSGFLHVDAGERHSCGLDGTLNIQCWGTSPQPESVYNPSGPEFPAFRALSVGGYHSCAIRTDGRLLCWGENWSGQLQVPEGTFVAVSAGRSHTCAIRTDGTRVCWGDTWLAPRLALDPDYIHELRPGEWASVYLQLRSESSSYQLREPRYAIVAGSLPTGFWLDPMGVLQGSSNESGRYPFTVEGRDRNGFAARRDLVLTIDGTPPVIDPQITGTSGENGWYTSPVTVAWTVTEPESEVTASYGCEPVTVDHDAEMRFLCDAYSAGGPAHQEVSIRIDLLAPDTQFTGTLPATGNEPNGVFAFAGTDGMSGVQYYECRFNGGAYFRCDSSFAFSTVPGEHTFEVRAVDFAGNADPTPARHTWFVDTTPPAIAASVSGTLGYQGWYVGDVQIDWSVGDPDSSIASTSGCNAATLASDTIGADFVCTATSTGGTSSKAVTVRRDATPPETTIASGPAMQGDSATFAFGGSDAASGVRYYECSRDGGSFSLCTSPYTYDVAPGAHTFAVRAMDAAGHRDPTPATYAWTVDPSPPTVQPMVTGSLGNEGWYIGDVQVSWTVSEPDSTVTTMGCNAVNLTSDTPGASFTCTATSAGGTTTRSVTLKRDATAPVIGAVATAAPNAAGWYRTDVTIAFTCSDALSGVVACPVEQVLSGEGAAIASSVRTVTDAAGNSASSNTVTVKIDRTAPTLAPSVSPSPLLLNAVASAIANGGDALSGVAAQSCAVPATNAIGGRTTTCTVADQAGNTANGNAAYRIIYGFNGYSTPVQNPGVLNVFKAGRSIPLKWRVLDAQGSPVTNLSSASVAAIAIGCTAATENRISLYGGSNGQLQNLGNGYYQLDWMAASSLRGACRRLELDLGDGVIHPALFKFN
jgi:alpha-tubulin suppressor-like RCC1 family protein